MKRYISALALAVVLVTMGAAIEKYSQRAPLTARSTVQNTGRVPLAAMGADSAHEPLWAYGFHKPPAPGDTAVPQPPPTRALRHGEDSAKQTRLRQLDGSRAAYSLVDIRDGHNAVDWFPEDHPPMPPIVAHGPTALGARGRGCGFCHLPNGKGRPEIKAAAEYFASIPYDRWIRVVETDSVPATRIVGNLFLPISRAKTEPIAGRIIEVPEDEEQTELYRNPRSGFIAYVPTGSIEKGADLVTRGGTAIPGDPPGGRKTTPCGTCHGPDLMGLADIPRIAGRSPSYLVRQLWDIRQGTRTGIAAQAMKPVLANLTGDDLVAIAAYVSSRQGQ